MSDSVKQEVDNVIAKEARRGEAAYFIMDEFLCLPLRLYERYSEDSGCMQNPRADNPAYIAHGEDTTVKFFTFQSAKVLDTKALNVTKDVADVTIEIKNFSFDKRNCIYYNY